MLNRAKAELDKEELAAAAAATKASSAADSKTKTAKAKQLKRAQDYFTQAQTEIAQLHVIPNVATSVVFLIVLRVLGTDLGGKIIAIVPFTPLRYIDKIISRGLVFSEGAETVNLESSLVTDIKQASAFMFIYMLSVMSIKVYVNKLFATEMPGGGNDLSTMIAESMKEK